jgi:hypothetical protein
LNDSSSCFVFRDLLYVRSAFPGRSSIFEHSADPPNFAEHFLFLSATSLANYWSDKRPPRLRSAFIPRFFFLFEGMPRAGSGVSALAKICFLLWMCGEFHSSVPEMAKLSEVLSDFSELEQCETSVPMFHFRQELFL